MITYTMNSRRRGSVAICINPKYKNEGIVTWQKEKLCWKNFWENKRP